jgi:hypothetical protein
VDTRSWQFRPEVKAYLTGRISADTGHYRSS